MFLNPPPTPCHSAGAFNSFIFTATTDEYGLAAILFIVSVVFLGSFPRWIFSAVCWLVGLLSLGSLCVFRRFLVCGSRSPCEVDRQVRPAASARTGFRSLSPFCAGGRISDLCIVCAVCCCCD